MVNQKRRKGRERSAPKAAARSAPVRTAAVSGDASGPVPAGDAPGNPAASASNGSVVVATPSLRRRRAPASSSPRSSRALSRRRRPAATGKRPRSRFPSGGPRRPVAPATPHAAGTADPDIAVGSVAAAVAAQRGGVAPRPANPDGLPPGRATVPPVAPSCLHASEARAVHRPIAGPHDRDHDGDHHHRTEEGRRSVAGSARHRAERPHRRRVSPRWRAVCPAARGRRGHGRRPIGTAVSQSACVVILAGRGAPPGARPGAHALAGDGLAPGGGCRDPACHRLALPGRPRGGARAARWRQVGMVHGGVPTRENGARRRARLLRIAPVWQDEWPQRCAPAIGRGRRRMAAAEGAGDGGGAE